MKEKNSIIKILKILKREYIKYGKPIVSKIVEENGTPYMVLVSTMISLRTKDEVTLKASERLFENANTPEKMLTIANKKIEQLIYPAGFYRNKARDILKTSQIIINRFNGKVPSSIDELLSLPGVGRKTANLVLALSFNKDAICVDTHVHRISNRLGLVRTKNPTDTEYALMKILPKKWWRTYNDMLVVWGQNVCTPLSPKCSQCKLNKLCPKVNIKKSR